MSQKSEMPEKFDLRSLDVAAEERAKLLELFPACRTEGGKIDFERLKALLGEQVDAGRERYGLTWPGKAACFQTIQRPSLATLRPKPEESVEFDTTQNLILEGDNLEVLKLLQKSYLGKVKMIYIDPPYNTGNDFIYPDNYTESLETYLEYTGQVDSEGRKFSSNTEADGRFHSKWLNMMYTRLYLARNLLREDGVIFISIDDHEVENLRRLCNEVFGEEAFCGTFVWEKKKKPSFLNAQMGNKTEYIVVYARNRGMAPALTSGQVETGKLYPFNNAGNPLAVLTFPPGSVTFGLEDTFFAPQDMSEGNIKTELLDDLEVRGGLNVSSFRLRGEWRYSQDTLDEFVAAGDQILIRRVPFRPNYVNPGDRDKKIANLLTIKGSGTPTYEDATAEVREVFGGDVIEYPKPVGLLATLINTVTRSDDLVIDFFAGSGTTAHAVLEQNQKDGGNRKFLLVQLPEPTDRTDYPTIADITKERVRRVIQKLNDADKDQLRPADAPKPDRGFRVFQLAPSNFKPWDGDRSKDAAALQQQLFAHEEHVLEDRSEQDLLYEILLKDGFELTTPIETTEVHGFRVHRIAGGTMLLCLQDKLTIELIQALADQRPERVVFLDRGFRNNDQLKANAAKLFASKAGENFQKFKTV